MLDSEAMHQGQVSSLVSGVVAIKETNLILNNHILDNLDISRNQGNSQIVDRAQGISQIKVNMEVTILEISVVLHLKTTILTDRNRAMTNTLVLNNGHSTKTITTGINTEILSPM